MMDERDIRSVTTDYDGSPPASFAVKLAHYPRLGITHKRTASIVGPKCVMAIGNCA